MITSIESKIAKVTQEQNYIDVELKDRHCFCLWHEHFYNLKDIKKIKKGATIRMQCVRSSMMVCVDLVEKGIYREIWCVI